MCSCISLIMLLSHVLEDFKGLLQRIIEGASTRREILANLTFSSFYILVLVCIFQYCIMIPIIYIWFCLLKINLYLSTEPPLALKTTKPTWCTDWITAKFKNRLRQAQLLQLYLWKYKCAKLVPDCKDTNTQKRWVFL